MSIHRDTTITPSSAPRPGTASAGLEWSAVDEAMFWDEVGLAWTHDLCVYPLGVLGWRYAGGFSVQEPFCHSNGKVRPYTGDDAGSLDGQPLLGRPDMFWVYDEFAESHGPFLYDVGDAENDYVDEAIETITERINNASVSSDLQARAALDELLDQVPAAGVCGYQAVPGSGKGRCVVHQGLPVIDHPEHPQAAKTRKVIRRRQKNETAERELTV